MMPLLSDDILQSLWFSCCRYNFQASVNAVLTQFIFLVTPSLHSSSFWWHFLAQFLIFLMTLPYTIPLLSDGISLCHPYTISLYGDTFLTQFLFFLTASVYAVRTQFFTQFFFLMKLCGHCDFFLWLLRSLGIRSHRPHSDHCCAVIGYLPLRSLKSVSLQCFSLFKWQLVSKQFFFSLSSSV